MSKFLREVCDKIDEAGGAIVAIDESKHQKIRFLNRHGIRCTLVIARSPSDHRVMRNVVSDLKRLMARQAPGPRYAA